MPFLRVVDQPGYWSGMVQTQPMGYSPCWNAGSPAKYMKATKIGVQSVPLCHSRKLDSSVYHIYIYYKLDKYSGWAMGYVYIYIYMCVIICLFFFTYYNESLMMVR